jgi:hypothetical protein
VDPIEYEAAFGQNLQNPKARLVDLKSFTFDRITFEMDSSELPRTGMLLGLPGRQRLAWKLIEWKLGKLDWYAALDNRTKKELDESISTIVDKEIIGPFSP